MRSGQPAAAMQITCCGSTALSWPWCSARNLPRSGAMTLAANRTVALACRKRTEAGKPCKCATSVWIFCPPYPRRHLSDGLNLLEKQLKAVKQSIDMALFIFSAQQLANMMREKVGQGIEIRLVTDPGFASRPFTEVLDYWVSPFQITRGRSKRVISRWIKRSRESAPPALHAVTNCTTSSPCSITKW